MKDNILKCEYNIDNGYVEVSYLDGNIIRLKCEKVEEKLDLNRVTESILQKLLDENPTEYVVMALNGELEEYCRLQCQGRSEQHDFMLQQYIKRGYNVATAEGLIRGFFRYNG